jgi:O-antigen/teichoic acid export membrane protein
MPSISYTPSFFASFTAFLNKRIADLHKALFGVPVSKEMTYFLKNLSWSFLGGGVSAVLFLIINILVARVFTPAEFGLYNMIVVIATLFYVFFLFGEDNGVIQKIAGEKNTQAKEVFMQASLLAFCIRVVIISSGAFLAGYFLAPSQEYFLFLTIFLGFSLALKSLIDAYLRVYQYFRLQAVIKIVDPILVMGLFFVVGKTFFQNQSISIFVGSLFLAGLITLSLPFLLFFKPRLFFAQTYTTQKNHWRNNIATNSIFFINIAAWLLIALDRYIIGRIFGLEYLGQYSLYFLTTFSVTATATVFFLNVFFPALSRNQQVIQNIIKKVVKLFLVIFPFWLGTALLFAREVFVLVGPQYSFLYSYGVMFALTAYLQMFYMVLNNACTLFAPRISVILALGTAITTIGILIIGKDPFWYLLGSSLVYLLCSLVIIFLFTHQHKK